MGRLTVRPLLMEYLTDHAGEVLHARKMMEDLGLTKGQVQQGMLHFTHKGLVEIMVQGNTWIYEPKVPEARVPDSEFHFEGDPLPGEMVKATANGRIEIGQMVEVVERVSNAGDVMEIIKILKGGKFLLQDCEGVLFVATRLEVQ